MLEAIIAGLGGLVIGFKMLFVNWQSLIMLGVGGVLLWLGIKKDCEPSAARTDRVRLHPGQHPHVGRHAQGRIYPDDL